MKSGITHFLFRTGGFLFCFVVLIILMGFLFRNYYAQKDFYKVNPKSNILILGNSHPVSAINDSLIKGVVNLAESGESMFYTYGKARKLVESNKNLKIVFIEFYIGQRDEKIIGEKYLNNKLPKYANILDLESISYLAVHNFWDFSKVQPIIFKQNFKFLSDANLSVIKRSNWGGYKFNENSRVDSILSVSDTLSPVENSKEISQTNIKYLKKLISYFREKNIMVCIFRAPVHPKYLGYIQESEYRNLIQDEFGDILFLDFSEFPLLNSDFEDLGHLNSKGAKKFSLFFKSILDSDIFNRNDPQVFINSEMEKLIID